MQGAVVGAQGVVGRGARHLVQLPPGERVTAGGGDGEAGVGDVVDVALVHEADPHGHAGGGVVGHGPQVGAVVGSGGHDGVGVAYKTIRGVLQLDVPDTADLGPVDVLVAESRPLLPAVGRGDEQGGVHDGGVVGPLVVLVLQGGDGHRQNAG